MSDNKETTLVSNQQAEAIIEVKETLASKQDVLMAIGQAQAFENVKKYATVSELLTQQKIKENKLYKGLTYYNEKQELLTVGTWEEFCKYFLGSAKSTIDEKLLNLQVIGEEYLESAQKLGLGNRELRKLRKLPEESRLIVLESKEFDLNDPEAVKELLEDEAVKHSLEVSNLQKEVKEANQTVKAVRANSDEKTKQLDELKELESKRRFSQEPWKATVLDHAKGMLEARILVEKGINQLNDIFNSFQGLEATLDEKGINLIARSLMAETTCTNQIVDEFCNNVFGVLGGLVEGDLDASDIYQEIELGIASDDTASNNQAAITE